jgi:high-affinity Fe2+/Pb2+ permease
MTNLAKSSKEGCGSQSSVPSVVVAVAVAVAVAAAAAVVVVVVVVNINWCILYSHN